MDLVSVCVTLPLGRVSSVTLALLATLVLRALLVLAVERTANATTVSPATVFVIAMLDLLAPTAINA